MHVITLQYNHKNWHIFIIRVTAFLMLDNTLICCTHMVLCPHTVNDAQFLHKSSKFLDYMKCTGQIHANARHYSECKSYQFSYHFHYKPTEWPCCMRCIGLPHFITS